MSCGEAISAVMLGAEIESLGKECEVLSASNLGIITDNNFSNANIVDIDITNIKRAFKKKFYRNSCWIPRVIGF